MKEIVNHADDISKGFILLDGDAHNEAVIIYVADGQDEAYRKKAKDFVRIFPYCGGGTAHIGQTLFDISFVYRHASSSILKPHKNPRHLAVVRNGLTGEAFLVMRKHVSLERLLDAIKEAFGTAGSSTVQAASLKFQIFFSDIVIGKLEH